MATTSDTFQVILAEFKKSLPPKELENFQVTTLADVRESIIRIQRDQEELKRMMNMTRLESFLEAMEQFGKVIEVFVNASNFVAFVWGPMKLILQTASTWTDAFEILLDAYSQIGEHMPLLGQYETLFGTNPNMKRVLSLMYEDILVFHRKALQFFRGRAAVWRQIFRSFWNDFGTRFKRILDSLSGHRQLIVEQARLVHLELYEIDSQKIRQHIEEYAQDREEKLVRLKKEETAERESKCSEVLEWFSAAQSTLLDHDGFRRLRKQYAGSGEWILQDEKVQNWMKLETPVSSVLWMNAIPGAGKTILASVIIDSCLRHSSSTTAYFYCNEIDTARNDCISIYKGLLSQLLNQCRELVPYCHDQRQTSGEPILNTTSLAEKLLKLFCSRIAKLYVIIDGLDECDPAQRKLVLLFFTKMVNHCDELDPGKLRVLFVSQDYTDIAKALQAAPILKLTAEDNKSDIKNYVCHWCKKIQQKFDIDADRAEFLQESTCIRSKGMFLYVKLVMENLYAQETQIGLLEEINTYGFPKSIGKAYERIIHRINRTLTPVQWSIACTLLGWVVCAKRPLKWREIQAAVSINFDKQSIEFRERKLRSDIQDYCGSLIQVLPGDRVELVHTTAKIYIMRSEYINIFTVESSLAALCLCYLTFECFDDDATPENLRQLTFEGTLSLQDYAVAKWPEHVRAIIQTIPNEISTDDSTQPALKEIETALEDFTSRYEDDIQDNSFHSTAEEDCKPFKKYQFYDNLLHVWSHVLCHHAKGPEVRNSISITALSDNISRNRELLEDLFTINMGSHSGENDNLTTFYGDRVFKCPRITCFYFHEGFKDAKSRDQHINRHDRPFNCDFPDCSIAVFGFSSNKDLEKHKRLFHPDPEDQANSFSAVKKPSSEAQFECKLCGKRFTRAFHHRSHMRSHYGERPFACTECGKAFTRENDRKRHEKIHARR